MNILITGGLGFSGSHAVVELTKTSKVQNSIVDNLMNSKISVLDR